MTRPLSIRISLGASALIASLGLLVVACSDSTQGRGLTSGGGGTALCSSIEASQCSCTTESVPGAGLAAGGACGPSNVPNALCCGDLQWPGSGLACSCNSYQCKQTLADGSCTCGNGTTGPSTTCGAAGLTCCQHPHGSCECGPSLVCDTNALDVQVAQCSKDVAQCQSSSQKVFASCQ